MVNQEHKENSVLSALKMEHIVFDKLVFTRKGFRKKEEVELKLQVAVAIDKIEDGRYKVSLGVSAERENEYDVSVQITGFCSISEEEPIKDTILEKNAVAILFPYVRSQLTMLTSQPETTPIVLPAMNINAMIENAKG